MQVKVILFSHLKYTLGKDEITLELAPYSTSVDLEKMIRTVGGDAIKTIPLRIAVNQEFILSPVKLNEDDEIALIPPVQGG